jgi:hypothetical protein
MRNQPEGQRDRCRALLGGETFWLALAERDGSRHSRCRELVEVAVFSLRRPLWI